jgi:hypothetical protein
MNHAHLGRQVTQTQSHFLLERCVVSMVEDDSVRVNVNAAGVEACALGLDERDTVFHRCAVFLLEVKKKDVRTVTLVESGTYG